MATGNDEKNRLHYFAQLKNVRISNFEYTRLHQLINRTKSKRELINDYVESQRAYLRGFRNEVLNDFKINRKHDRRVKKWLVVLISFFFVLLFSVFIFALLAIFLGWGVVEDLNEWFKGSLIGILISGVVSLAAIVFKYIFNKTDDVFYGYSVELYKHIITEMKNVSHDKEDEDEGNKEDME